MPHIVYLESVTGYGPAETVRRLELLQGYLRPGFTIELLNPPDGPKILEQPADFEQAHRAASSAVRALGPDRCGAIIAAGAVDPGLAALRAAARVPIVGPGETALFLARLVGARLAILTVAPAVPAAQEMTNNVPARPDVVVIHAINTTVRRILSDLDEGRRLMREEAVAAVRQHKPDAIYLGSMTQGSLGIAEDLRKTLGIPVLDPLPISVYAAQEAAAAGGG